MSNFHISVLIFPRKVNIFGNKNLSILIFYFFDFLLNRLIKNSRQVSFLIKTGAICFFQYRNNMDDIHCFKYCMSTSYQIKWKNTTYKWRKENIALLISNRQKGLLLMAPLSTNCCRTLKKKKRSPERWWAWVRFREICW